MLVLPFIHPSIHPSVYPALCPSIRACMHASIHPSLPSTHSRIITHNYTHANPDRQTHTHTGIIFASNHAHYFRSLLNSQEQQRQREQLLEYKDVLSSEPLGDCCDPLQRGLVCTAHHTKSKHHYNNTSAKRRTMTQSACDVKANAFRHCENG